MELFAPPVERLIEEFAKLPGIGQKTAQRLAFHVLDLPKEDAERFADAIREAKAKTFTCRRCQNLTDSEICPICSDKTRNQKVICVVAEPRDVIAFERTKEYKGLYHVLHGTLSPMGHVGPDDIRIRELVKRVAEEETEEVILATNPDTEGEATAMYISRLLQPFGIKITRLAYGIPVGGHLEFVDEVTLTRALEGRKELLSIARAAVADPPVMILDEATSSIDTRTESIVQAGMDGLMYGRTVFVIAHRLSTIQNADVIMVLQLGHIIERGNHEQLIAEHGKYYQLYTGAFELE